MSGIFNESYDPKNDNIWYKITKNEKVPDCKYLLFVISGRIGN